MSRFSRHLTRALGRSLPALLGALLIAGALSGIRGASVLAAEKTVSSASPSPCDSWFGPFVVALACDPKEAGKQNAGSGPGTFIIEAPSGIRTDSSPGIAQAVGNPLRPGKTITVAGTAPKSTQLALRVKPKGGTESDYLFKKIGLEQGGRAVAKIEKDGAYGKKNGVPDVRLNTPKGTFKPTRVFTTPKPPRILKIRRLAHRLRVRIRARAPKTTLQIYSKKKLISGHAFKTRRGHRKTVSLKLKARAKARYLIAVSVNPGHMSSKAVRRKVPRKR
jgi:hypothetical protein